MEIGGINELARYRFEKAQGNLQLASELYQNGHYGIAQNRAYYAVFDAMRAVNALDHFDSSKHSGVIAHFNQNYVKTGVFPPTTSAVIRRAAMLREKSDYEDFYEPDAEDTEVAIDNAQGFIENVLLFLQKKGVLSSIDKEAK